MKIGGNISAIIQVQTVEKNELGEDVPVWVDAVLPFVGWLDLSSGDSNMIYNAKIQESTHVFMCDYFPLVTTVGDGEVKITPENSRMIVDDVVYEVMVYDNPMNMNQQLEIFLKYVGGV